MDRVELLFGNVTNGSSLKELGTKLATFNSFTGYFEYTVDTSVFTDGEVNITAVAHDEAGNANMTITNMTFYIDNNPPMVVVTEPAQGDYVEGAVNITVNISDGPFIPSGEWRVDGGPWQKLAVTGNEFIFHWSTANLTDGQHTVTIRAVDKLHHVTSLDLQVIVDNHNPFADLVAPLRDQFVEGVLVFRASASDAIGLSNVTMRFNGTNYTMTYNGVSRQYDYAVNTLGYEDGVYNVTVTAVDLSGKVTVVGPITFNIDNNDPTLAVNEPDEGGFVSGNYTLNITSEDVFPYKAVFRIRAMDWMELTRSGRYWTGRWNTILMVDGQHTVTIRVTDRALHVVEQTLRVMVDNTPPTCAVASPVVNQYVEGTFTFQVLATDAVGIADVRLLLFGSEVQASFSTVSGMYEYSLDTLVWTEDNIRNITAIARDRSGKETKAGPVNFRVDNHAPVMTVDRPQSGDYVKGVDGVQCRWRGLGGHRTVLEHHDACRRAPPPLPAGA
jgi:hypothetical protein